MTALAGAFALSMAHASAYMLSGGEDLRQNRVTNLIMAYWPNNPQDNSGWFKAAVSSGAADWNSAPTPVVINVELYADSNADIMFTVRLQSSSDPGPSNETCLVPDSDNVHCDTALEYLYEGPNNMNSGTPNYDEETVVHETGHALGLAHSCTRNVVMSGPNSQCSNGGAPYACPSDTNCVKYPQQDDVNGVVAMYGHDSYQYGGCSSVQIVRPPQLTIPVPPPPTVPESNVIDGTLQEGESTIASPTQTAINVLNQGLSATAKVVPYSKLPTVHPPLLIGSPC